MSKPTLPALDSSLYPQFWHQQTFDTPKELLIAMLTGNLILDPKTFTELLVVNDIYQQWINFTVFGSYIQRTFTAFYQQPVDSLDRNIPALFRHELMRHAQYLPLEQAVFVAGDIPSDARQEKLLTTTINPATAVANMQNLVQPTKKSAATSSQPLTMNYIGIKSRQVVGFAMRHNKNTSARTRNEVLILDFNDLRLIDEQSIEDSNTGSPILLRCYELR